MKTVVYKFVILGMIIWLLVITIFLLIITQKQKIGLIDSQMLITNQAQKIASLYPKGNVPTEKLQQLADQIKNSVDFYARANNIILLAKHAVWGGDLPNYTQNIIEANKED
jgi:hypothetical protein